MQTIFYPQAFTNLPTWEDIILDLNRNVQEREHVIFLPDLGFVTHKGERIASVDSIAKEIHKLRPNEPICTSHLYISLLQNSQTFGRHKDNTDVYFVLALGRMKWIIETDTTQEFNLVAGDMIYIPQGAYHTPVPLSPRVGISVGFN